LLPITIRDFLPGQDCDINPIARWSASPLLRREDVNREGAASQREFFRHVTPSGLLPGTRNGLRGNRCRRNHLRRTSFHGASGQQPSASGDQPIDPSELSVGTRFPCGNCRWRISMAYLVARATVTGDRSATQGPGLEGNVSVNHGSSPSRRVAALRPRTARLTVLTPIPRSHSRRLLATGWVFDPDSISPMRGVARRYCQATEDAT
jgi:hypothetical protein